MEPKQSFDMGHRDQICLTFGRSAACQIRAGQALYYSDSSMLLAG